MKKSHLHFSLFLIIFFTGISVMAVSQNTPDKVDKTFQNITTVDVEGSFSNVRISGEKRYDVALTGEITSSRNYDIKIRYQKNGETLKVWLDRPKSIRGQVNGEINLKVPANTNIRVKNSSGNIWVENAGQSEIELNSSSGNISVKNIDTNITMNSSSGNLDIKDVTGDVHASASSGSIDISGLNGDLYSVTSSGSQRIEGVKGNLKVTLSSGSLLLRMVNGNVDVRTSSGSIKAEQISGNLTAQSSSGSIKLDKVTGALSIKTSSGSQKGTGIRLTDDSSFMSVSGSIVMELLNTEDDLSFNLHSSSGSLFAKGASDTKELVIDLGPIEVYGKSSSGSQYYK